MALRWRNREGSAGDDSVALNYARQPTYSREGRAREQRLVREAP